MRGALGAWIAMAVVVALAGCDATTPSPPAHDHAWLSYKYNRTCSAPTVTTKGCAALYDLSEADSYYTAIGIDLTQPFNFDTDWLPANGFTSGAQEVRAAYGNLSDLAFGRDMHCVQSGQNIACYVTNYGPSPDTKVPPFL